jgi:hypothetical protein
VKLRLYREAEPYRRHSERKREIYLNNVNFMSAVTHLKLTSIIDLLRYWISQQVNQECLTWLDEKREQISNKESPLVFFTAFSAASRHTGKADLKLTPFDLKAASAIVPGWFPVHWSVDQAARTLIVLALPHDNCEKYLHILEQVFNTADLGELVALYQALPLLHYPEKLRDRACEGIRSNMTAVFNAVALQNPYPAEYFDNRAWNQMILKALFVGSPLYLIQGIDARNNPELSRMLLDYANERQAAKRSVSPELWELVEKQTRRQGDKGEGGDKGDKENH